MLKNRYYVITKDNETYAYLCVKKDFYTEGILIENKAILLGYFYFYQKFKAFILDNSMQSFEHPLEGICVSTDDRKSYFDMDGKIILSDYSLYDVSMDEYFYEIILREKSSNIQIKLIEDDERIKDINYLIRMGIRNLNELYKFFYNSIKKHRYGNLKELIEDGFNEVFVDEFGTKLSLEVIEDIKRYLKTMCDDRDKKEETISQKKLRKRKKRK